MTTNRQDEEQRPDREHPGRERAQGGDGRPDRSPDLGMAWRILPWLLAGLFLLAILGPQLGDEGEALSYTGFKEAVGGGRVTEVTFEGDSLRGYFYPEGAAMEQEEPVPFRSVLPQVEDPELMPLLAEQGVTIHAESPETPWWQWMLIWVLVLTVILGLFFYASYRLQSRLMGGGGAGGPFGMGRSTAKRVEHEQATEVGFNDVAGADNAKLELQQVADYLADPGKFQRLGAKIPRGVLLMGPPGTGKTLLARAVAGEAQVPFFSISGSEFIEMLVGVGAARVRDTFATAKNESPAIIFIDEIDSVGRARGTGLGGGHDEREQTLNQILGEMDGFAKHEAVVVLAATNRPDVLDPALMRPGRFDRKVTLELPHKEARRRILEVHIRNVPLAEDVDLDALADRTAGFSGADLENFVNEAALLAGSEERERVDMEMLMRARDRIVLGGKRHRPMSDEERRLVAYHESGHALAATLLPHADPVERVTIIPRGQALGATEQTPNEERSNLLESQLRDRIGVMLGGRIAESLIFGEVGTGSEQDLRQATQLARRMVANWGMSGKLGPVGYRQGQEHVFLGREVAQERDFSEQTAYLIDTEVRELIAGIERRLRELFESHRAALETLAERLIETETLAAEEVRSIVMGKEAAAAESH